ncbi:amidase family protein [Streptomyces sp. AB3(2024)]|uniref:amidase family protein n=1 Tax=Streptomyces sp. AB3(2024) TaxID=3317321 RepID=UPI0035A2E3C6
MLGSALAHLGRVDEADRILDAAEHASRAVGDDVVHTGILNRRAHVCQYRARWHQADEVFSGLAVHGALSRSVRDSAALLDLVHGPEAGDPYAAQRPTRPYAQEVTRSPGSLRIGLLTRPWGGRAVDWEEFVLANARIWSTHLVTWIDGLAAAHARPVDSTTVEPEALAAYSYGRQVGGTEFVHALAMRNGVARAIGRYFTAYDLLLTPTLPEPPVPLGTYAEGADGPGCIGQLFHRSSFTAPFNVAGTPAMSVPLETDPATGFPVGVQFAAGYGREDVLFRLAGQLERAAPWARRTPAVWAGGHDGA